MTQYIEIKHQNMNNKIHVLFKNKNIYTTKKRTV